MGKRFSMTDSINIKGLDKAVVLAVLFNASVPRGVGFLQRGSGSQDMSIEHARVLIDSSSDKQTLQYDYVLERPLKVAIGGDEFDPRGFDRNNGGPGSALRVIDRLREVARADTSAQSSTCR